MTTEDQDTRAVIAAALARCRRVATGADELKPVLAPVLPFEGDDLESLNLPERTASVALLKRYEQLQDLLGRLSRAIISWEGGDAREMSQRDLANWMEKRGFVDDAESWMKAVGLRNRLVHEYPVDEAEQVTRVNRTWVALVELQALLGRLSEFLESQNLA